MAEWRDYNDIESIPMKDFARTTGLNDRAIGLSDSLTEAESRDKLHIKLKDGAYVIEVNGISDQAKQQLMSHLEGALNRAVPGSAAVDEDKGHIVIDESKINRKNSNVRREDSRRFEWIAEEYKKAKAAFPEEQAAEEKRKANAAKEEADRPARLAGEFAMYAAEQKERFERSGNPKGYEDFAAQLEKRVMDEQGPGGYGAYKAAQKALASAGKSTSDKGAVTEIAYGAARQELANQEMLAEKRMQSEYAAAEMAAAAKSKEASPDKGKSVADARETSPNRQQPELLTSEEQLRRDQMWAYGDDSPAKGRPGMTSWQAAQAASPKQPKEEKAKEEEIAKASPPASSPKVKATPVSFSKPSLPPVDDKARRMEELHQQRAKDGRLSDINRIETRAGQTDFATPQPVLQRARNGMMRVVGYQEKQDLVLRDAAINGNNNTLKIGRSDHVVQTLDKLGAETTINVNGKGNLGIAVPAGSHYEVSKTKSGVDITVESNGNMQVVHINGTDARHVDVAVFNRQAGKEVEFQGKMVKTGTLSNFVTAEQIAKKQDLMDAREGFRDTLVEARKNPANMKAMTAYNQAIDKLIAETKKQKGSVKAEAEAALAGTGLNIKDARDAVKDAAAVSVEVLSRGGSKLFNAETRERYLKSLDANHDGNITANEVQSATERANTMNERRVGALKPLEFEKVKAEVASALPGTKYKWDPASNLVRENSAPPVPGKGQSPSPDQVAKR